MAFFDKISDSRRKKRLGVAYVIEHTLQVDNVVMSNIKKSAQILISPTPIGWKITKTPWCTYTRQGLSNGIKSSKLKSFDFY